MGEKTPRHCEEPFFGDEAISASTRDCFVAKERLLAMTKQG
jgi:hypothetical protein